MLNDFKIIFNIDQNIGNYSGQQHWVYYLLGALFIVASLIFAFLSYKSRNTKLEYQNILDSLSWYKKFWYENKFLFMISLFLIFLVTGIVLLMMNDVFLKQ